MCEAPKKLTLADAFESVTGVGGGDAEVRYHPDNVLAWAARMRGMKTAKTSISSVYFSLEKDPFGLAFMGLCLKKQKTIKDFKVRIMADAMASHSEDGFMGINLSREDKDGKRTTARQVGAFLLSGFENDYAQEIVEAGGDVRFYNTVKRRPFEGRNAFISAMFKPGTYDSWDSFTGRLSEAAVELQLAAIASNHDKIITVDDMWSITGGRNIGRAYLSNPEDMPTAWSDSDVEMIGEGPAKALRFAFEREFDRSAVEKVLPEAFGNWDERDAELVSYYVMMDIWMSRQPYTEDEKAARRVSSDAMNKANEANAWELVVATRKRLTEEGIVGPNGRKVASEAEEERLMENARELVKYLELRGAYSKLDKVPFDTAEVKILDQTSVAGGRENQLAPELVKVVGAVEDNLYIKNPYVVLTEDMMSALKGASARGVKVIIGTNSPLSTDSDVTQAFFLHAWPNVLKELDKAQIFVATGERKQHAKIAVADGSISWVSTYNQDFLSGNVLSEVGALIRSKTVAKRVTDSMIADKNDRRNNVLEYTIMRDESGKAILDKDGNATIVFGPKDHLPKALLETYETKVNTWQERRKSWPVLSPIWDPMMAENK
ncbi:MAG: hypothetical protein IT381_27290 [Deltaproteobacteria bacterium]|nr:hypothetical protein [Deltaproteobacteria bacterium]